MLYKVAGLDKHTAASAGRVQQNALSRFQHIDDHLNKRLGGKEHSVVLGDVFSKFVKKILIDAPDNVPTDVIKSAVIEYAKEFRQQFVGKHGIVLRQHTVQLFALLFDELHRVVYYFAKAAHCLAIYIFNASR